MTKAGTHSPQRIGTLIELVRVGAAEGYVAVPSAELGRRLGLTQQGTSTRLIDLESAGLITRVHTGRAPRVKVTPDGLNALRSIYGELRSALERPPSKLDFVGTVFTGLGEGGYYVSLEGYARHFRKSLGFIPFPGTLNLRLRTPEMAEAKGLLGSLPGVSVAGFEKGGRTYGPVKCFRARLDGQPAAVLAIERTHYDNTVLEVISPKNLRRALKLKDGDTCTVSVFTG